MGQTLSEPITTKISTEDNDKHVMYGSSSMQGWRLTMEDAHTTEINYLDTGASFFAVFDGHGGAGVARYSGEQLYKRVFGSADYEKKQYEKALRMGNLNLDEDLRKDPEYMDDTSGCTAIVALLTTDQTLFVSNAGDSRAIISIDNGKAIAMSEDHKPVNPREGERIKNAGGYVEFGRVNGSLALSRALGDFEFKKNTELPAEQQAVSAEPEITKHKLSERDEFMVLACDGIWDCMSNQDVVDFIRWKLCERHSLKLICEELMDHCLAKEGDMTGLGCDNMTVIIVGFLGGRTIDEWYNWMAAKEAEKPDFVEEDDDPIESLRSNQVSSTALEVTPITPAAAESTPPSEEVL